ncbi:hypothetical protein [Saccharothrix sp.]|uniref:alpha/beta fold hydrolase n=1 Tax=Saccharothrix sp. TaxID=1873460 RepID=UPI0028114AC3|nr:hypothetical protein [Saccharothrix sp.]
MDDDASAAAERVALLDHRPQEPLAALEITAELDLPTLLVHGGNGSPVTDDAVERLRHLVPHATVTRIPAQPDTSSPETNR